VIFFLAVVLPFGWIWLRHPIFLDFYGIEWSFFGILVFVILIIILFRAYYRRKKYGDIPDRVTDS